MRILIAAGASGGHIFPALSLAEELRGDGEVIFLCDKGKSQEQISKGGFQAISLPVSRRKSWLDIPVFIFNQFRSFYGALGIIKDYRPDLIAGFGSYVSLPVVTAGWVMRVPIIIHEQNVLPGTANRISAGFAGRIAVSFKEGGKYFPQSKTLVTGCPVRSKITDIDEAAARWRFNFRDDKFTILVLGGSQGSRSINLIFISAIEQLPGKEKLQVIHITGKNDYQQISEAYKRMKVACAVFDFLEEIGYAYKSADLVVSRAGASAIAEICCFGKPSILVAYPFARGHQLQNANIMEEAGAAVLIAQQNLSSGALGETMLKLMHNRGRLQEMALRSKGLAMPDAAGKLADEIRRFLRVK